MATFDPLDQLDASLQDFELPPQHPHQQLQSPAPPLPPSPFGYQPQRQNSAFRVTAASPPVAAPGSAIAAAATAAAAAATPATSAAARSPTTTVADSMMSESAADSSSMASAGGYSPPAWRRLGNGDRSSGFWRHNADNILGAVPSRRLGKDDVNNARRSRESSPNPFDSADDDDVADMEDFDEDTNDEEDDRYHDGGNNNDVFEQAVRTRLPTGSLSPEKDGADPDRDADTTARLGMHATAFKLSDYAPKSKSISVLLTPRETPLGTPAHSPAPPPAAQAPAPAENYIRFAVRAEVQHRTEPIESAIGAVRRAVHSATKSWTSLLCSAFVVALAATALRGLFGPAMPRPSPDLVKVANIARSFEPLIYFSENGAAQVGDLQATGVAVWDLGESVRLSNMTSAPLIVKELDGLSESLKTLAMEMTRFSANVDGDIDGILIVMDWARRELSALQTLPSAPLSSAFDNIHVALSDAGVLEDRRTGQPTRLGHVAAFLFGASRPQRTRQTLQRTFDEFLAVLEEAITTELEHSLALFRLYEAIDHQFLNLGRAVARESSAQDERHADLLAGLWTRLLGPKASEVRKYERNRLLLQSVRDKTMRNKNVLQDHNAKLQALKASLESLRRKLVSPLVRSVNSSTLTLEEQISGLAEVGTYLEGVRARQKSKLLEMLYGSGSGAVGRRTIEDRGYIELV